MKAVLDTNVFISGIFWQGFCNEIINLWKNEKFSLIVSGETLLELRKVLTDFKIQLPEELIKEWIELIISNSIFVEVHNHLDVVKDDPKDNTFIESALAGNADYIVSQENHLLKIKEFQGIKIISPEEFLSLF